MHNDIALSSLPTAMNLSFEIRCRELPESGYRPNCTDLTAQGRVTPAA
jgi:hypothetical protein